MKRTRGLLRAAGGLLAALIGLSGAADAEPVALNRSTGQGYVFNQAGNCFVVFPKHVLNGRSRKITLTAAGAAATGDANVLQLNTVHDLAIGYVNPGFESRCTESWAKFPKQIQPLLTGNTTGLLTRIAPNGILERFPVQIENFDNDKIYGQLLGDASIQQGGSGGFLLIKDQLAGMLLATEDGRRAQFLRVDEIYSEVSRLVETGVERRVTAPGQSDKCPASKITFTSIICDREPVTPDFACSNLVQGLPLLIPAESLPVTIYAELKVPEPKAVSRIALRSVVSDENAEGAKSIKVMVDSSDNPNMPYWRYFGAADMAPTGAIDLSNGSQPFARRVKVTIRSSWSSNKPVNLSCLSLL